MLNDAQMRCWKKKQAMSTIGLADLTKSAILNTGKGVLVVVLLDAMVEYNSSHNLYMLQGRSTTNFITLSVKHLPTRSLLRRVRRHALR